MSTRRAKPIRSSKVSTTLERFGFFLFSSLRPDPVRVRKNRVQPERFHEPLGLPGLKDAILEPVAASTAPFELAS